jgi:hypothetical protein
MNIANVSEPFTIADFRSLYGLVWLTQRSLLAV